MKSPLDSVPGLNPQGRKRTKDSPPPGRPKRGERRPSEVAEVRKRGFETTTKATAALVDVNKPLTEQQKAFVKFWAQGETILSAAHRAGYSDNGTYAYRMIYMPNILALYNEEKRLYEEASQMNRKKVMDGLLEGVEMAKMMGEPASVINGWKTIGQMCGYFEPVKRKVEVTVNGRVVMEKVDSMSTETLLRFLQGEIEGELEALDGPDADGG